MASIGGNSIRKHLRVGRRRQKRRVSSTCTGTLSLNITQSARADSTLGDSTGDSDAVYLVEDILGERIVKGQKYYKVRWQGFPPESDSWEPEENLSNVLEAINHYHHRRQTEELTKSGELSKDCLTGCADSPASLPTPPSTPGCSLAKRLRGASEERHSHPSGTKRKYGPKSRTSGRYEYVPKHELVASKTKYFDDIRDGKIDLSSNDLYSRVKTRRRINETSVMNTGTEFVHSTSNSVQGDPEPDGEGSMDHCSLKREPSSPASDSIHATGSFSGFQSTVDSTESEQLKPHLTDQIESLSEPISDMAQAYSMAEFDAPQELPQQVTMDRATQSEEQVIAAPGICMPSMSSSYQREILTVDVALSPINVHRNAEEDTTDVVSLAGVTQSEKSTIEESDTIVIGQPCGDSVPTVSSIRKLVQNYFRLIAYVQRSESESTQSNDTDMTGMKDELRSLDDLPRLVTYRSQTPVKTTEDFLDVITSQRWSLLSSSVGQNISQSTTTSGNLPTKTALPPWCTSTDQLNTRDLLIRALQVGADRPIILDQLFRTGLDPNDQIFDESVQWPLLVYAVRLRRLYAVQALLDAGANPNSMEPGPKRRTVLGIAIAAGDVDMAHMLILAGANFYEVETGTTALSLIMKLINAYSTTPVQLSNLPPLSVAEVQDRRRSIDGELHHVPPPSPPPGFEIPTVPKSVLCNAVIYSAASTGSDSTALAGSVTPSVGSTMRQYSSHGNAKWNQHTARLNEDCSQPGVALPSVDSLRRLYDLVAVHHARLSVLITGLVRGWLIRAGLTQVGLVCPCQWTCTKQQTASMRFTWPHPFPWSKSVNSQLVVPILLLVHGRLVPPACYDVWMDDDGPCLIDSVCLDGHIMQKPLGRVPFVTTLFPLRWDQGRTDVVPTKSEAQSHEVTVTFRTSAENSSFRPTCVALMIVAVSQDCRSSAAKTTSSNDRSPLRPPPGRSSLPSSNRTTLGSLAHAPKQRSVS